MGEVVSIAKDVVEEIAALYREAVRGGRESLVKYAAVGAELNKEKISHGGAWIKFLLKNEKRFGFSESKARKMCWLEENLPVNGQCSDDEIAEISAKFWGNAPPRGTFGTGENEWYTPAYYIELARKVLGEIDLDPASNPQANETVKAKKFYTHEDDGLNQPWTGWVWLNPPYGTSLIGRFAAKMIAHYVGGEVTAAVMLTHSYTDTEWFQSLAAECSAICFTNGRIRFVAPDGSLASPIQGQAFFYFGDRVHDFWEAFHGVGFIVEVQR